MEVIYTMHNWRGYKTAPLEMMRDRTNLSVNDQRPESNMGA